MGTAICFSAQAGPAETPLGLCQGSSLSPTRQTSLLFTVDAGDNKALCLAKKHRHFHTELVGKYLHLGRWRKARCIVETQCISGFPEADVVFFVRCISIYIVFIHFCKFSFYHCKKCKCCSSLLCLKTHFNHFLSYFNPTIGIILDAHIFETPIL